MNIYNTSFRLPKHGLTDPSFAESRRVERNNRTVFADVSHGECRVASTAQVLNNKRR